MASLKEVRIRIASIKSTQQITSAMKMVAASKLRRAQNAIVGLRPYATKLQMMMSDLSASAEETESAVYIQERKVEKVLLVLVSSNRGLCGGFNANVIKKASELIQTQYAEQNANGNLEILAIGKKAAEYFARRKFLSAGNYHETFDDLRFENVARIAEKIMKDFADKKYDRVDIIYNRFKNAAVQQLQVEQFLPLVPQQATQTGLIQPNYIFEPSKEEILDDLIPRMLKIQLYKAVLDSYASEHGARMTAMHKATDNASDILRDLKLMYNKARQASITKEILEIVSGAEALKG